MGFRGASLRQCNYYSTSANQMPSKWDKYAFTACMCAPLWIFPLISIILNAVYTVPIGIIIFIAYKIINPKKRSK